jgi:hypothetical protein
MKAILILLISFSVSAIGQSKMNILDSKIKQVFIKKNDKLEVVRLYDNGIYEHLKYTKNSYYECTVKRNLGKYQKTGNSVMFEVPSGKEFDGNIYNRSFFKDKHLYTSKLAHLIKKNTPLLSLTRKKKYRKPYYFQLDQDVIVNNENIEAKIDIEEIVNYIIKKDKSEKEKAYSIAHFITKSVSYDYEYLKTRIHDCPIEDSKKILAGKNRLTVCSGYSKVFNELATIAGLESKYVTGYTKQSITDLNKIDGYHAWNIVTIEGKKKIFDVTWADGGDEHWLSVDPSLMIYSHFPDDSVDQLLDKAITKEEYKNLPVVIPYNEGKYNPFSLNKGTVNCDSVFHIAFSGRVQIDCRATHSAIFITHYIDEKYKSKSFFYNKCRNVSRKYYGDSTHVYIPLEDIVTPLRIEVDNRIRMNFMVVKGGRNMLMNHYLANSKMKLAEPSVKAAMASVVLGREDILKEIVGDTSSVFFNQEGQLQLTKNILSEIKKWDGSISKWSIVRHYSNIASLKSNNKTDWRDENYFQITDNLRLIFDKEDTGIVIKDLRYNEPFLSSN